MAEGHGRCRAVALLQAWHETVAVENGLQMAEASLIEMQDQQKSSIVASGASKIDSCRPGTQIRGQLQAWETDSLTIASLKPRFVDSSTLGTQIRRQLHVWEPDSLTVASLRARFLDSCRPGAQNRRQLQAWDADSSTVAGLGPRFDDSCRPGSQIR